MDSQSVKQKWLITVTTETEKPNAKLSRKEAAKYLRSWLKGTWFKFHTVHETKN